MKYLFNPLILAFRYSSLTQKNIAKMTSCCTLTYVTCPNIELAKSISEHLVQNKLAACVNIVKGIESVYAWKGKIEHDNEQLLIIKSTSSKTPAIERSILEKHPYECPEVVTLKIESGNQKYLDWIMETVEELK